jgi:SAM-dependent methyltransferase
LAAHFRQVHATDASAGQIDHAPSHTQVSYAVAPAHASGLPDASVDLVTVAQALHWFAEDSFYDEARRVLKPGGLLAAWSYGMIVVDGDAVNDAIRHFYHQVIGPYWPPERRHVETGYRELPFPFARIATPQLAMHVSWPLPQLLGYLGSWSASVRYREATGEDAVEALGKILLNHWGDHLQPRSVAWPLAILAGRT